MFTSTQNCLSIHLDAKIAEDYVISNTKLTDFQYLYNENECRKLESNRSFLFH